MADFKPVRRWPVYAPPILQGQQVCGLVVFGVDNARRCDGAGCLLTGLYGRPGAVASAIQPRRLADEALRQTPMMLSQSREDDRH